MTYSYPKTKEEYWDIVDRYFQDLYNIMVMFLPKHELAKVDNLRLTKDRELSRLFELTWGNAPDNRSIHNIPAWHVLCDLCSEAYVLYEDELENEQVAR